MMVFITYSLNLFGQDQNKRLNFILLIDNEIPKTSIYDGFFFIKNNIGVIKDSIAFDYQVGALMMTDFDYKRLFSQDQKSKIIIKFKFKRFFPDSAVVSQYEYAIPANWVNEKYMILKVYNRYNNESREKYYFNKDSYRIIIETPLGGNVIATKKHWPR